jgi:hypothetical protein
MPHRPFTVFPVLPFAVWTELAMKTGEMMLASAQVIGHRSHRIARAGANPSARDRREFHRMGQEKIDAARESAFAMGRHVAGLNPLLGLKAWQDMLAAGNALFALAGTRSITGAMAGQAKLARAVSKSTASAARVSEVTAKTAGHGLKPVHSRATANAKRLRRG